MSSYIQAGISTLKYPYIQVIMIIFQSSSTYKQSISCSQLYCNKLLFDGKMNMRPLKGIIRSVRLNTTFPVALLIVPTLEIRFPALHNDEHLIQLVTISV